MRRPFSSWTRTFSALGVKLAKKKKTRPLHGHGRKARMESLESRLLLDAAGWSPGLFIVDTPLDVDNGDYSLGDRSLREALSLATGSIDHRIEFDTSLAGATIKLNAELQPLGNVEIAGLGSDLLTLDAQGSAGTPRRAFLIDTDSIVTFSGLTITGGYADRGGAIRLDRGDLLLDQVVLLDNHASIEGGGIAQLGGGLEILESTVEKNSAQYGGGVYAELGENDFFYLTESSLLYNVAQHASLDSAAGGLYVAGKPVGGATVAGEALLFDSTIAHNLSQSTVDNANTEHHTGGVFLSQVEYGEMIHTTISHNGASDTSGGLNLVDSDTVILINATIAFNEVAEAGVTGTGSGGISIAGGTVVEVANSIVAENRAGGSPHDVTGSFYSTSTRNLLGTGPDPGGSNSTILSAGESAGLVPLADNGGGTLTHALVPDSPAVDGGSDSRTYDPGNLAIKDQRGDRRYVNYIPGVTAGIVDVGAFELQPQIITTADFNGDGREDQAFYDPASGNLEVLTELGLRHESSRWANLLPPVGNAYWSKFYAGDFNGDGRDDLAAFNSTAGEWTIAISDGNRFVLNHLQLGTPDDHWQITSVGDFDGDGSDELIGRTHLSGSWQVLHFSEQAGASLENWGHSFGGYTDWTIFVGDVDQDGRDDLVARRPFVPGNWYAVLSEPTEGATGHFSGSIGLSKSLDPYFVGGNFTVADFDGQFHPEFARDATSVSTRGPFQEALDLFSPIYNEIEVEFYPGLMKGPQATRETRAGNPWDQAALLSEDLLAAGFVAEIVTGRITVSIEDLMEWTGTLAPNAAISLIFSTLDPNVVYSFINSETYVSFRHTWVQVRLPTSTGLGWLNLDPTWKFKERQPGILVELPGPRGTFDEFDFFADPKDQLPTEYYGDRIAEYLAENSINASLADVPYEGPIHQQRLESIATDDRLTQATNIQSEGTFSQIVANDARDHTHRIRLSVDSWTRDIVLPESPLSTYTFQRDLSSFTFFVDGIPEATVALPAGGAELLVIHADPGQAFAASSRFYTDEFTSGEAGRFYSIAVDVGQHSTTSLDALREDLIGAAADGVTTDDIPAVLDYVGASYWYKRVRTSEQAGALVHAAAIRISANSGLIKAKQALKTGSFEHLQTPIVPENLVIDIEKSDLPLVDIRYDGTAETEFGHTEGIQIAGYTGSALEHETIEEVINSPSISTMRGLKEAYQGDPFFAGLPSNSIYILDSVLEGTERKVYLRGEIGNRANENGYLPYEENRIDTVVSSAQMLRDYFPQHKLNPSGANDDLNNPEPTRIWKALTEDVDGDAFAIVPWAHSYVGDSQQYWRGSAYYVQKQSVSNVNDGGFLITGSSDGPPLNGGNSSGYIRFRNPKIRVGANILRNFAGDPVDVLNGNMFRDKLDIAMPNVGVPLDFSRHYNSQSTFNVGLGVGWTHTFSDRLLQESGVTNELIWLTSEGVQHTFTKVAGNWELPLELFGQMQEVSGGYVYSDSDGLEHHFQTVTPTQASGTTNSIARVSKIVDRNGHGVEIQYPSSSQGFLPNSVQDVHSSSRRLDFTTASGNRHTAIKKYADDQLVGTWGYGYDGGGTLLTTVTNPAQDSVALEYYSSGFSQGVVSRITEADGAYHAYEYYPNGRVFRVKEGTFDGTNYLEESSHSFSYDLGRNRTDYADENGNLETYLHQEDGRLLRHTNGDGSRTDTAWGVDDGAGGIVADTDLLMRTQTNETGGVEVFEYYLNETGTNAFKNRRLYRSKSRHLPGEVPLITEYDYGQAASGNEHLVQLSSVVVDPGTSDSRVSSLQYDDKGRLLQTTNPLNEITQYSYFADNHTTPSLRGLRQSQTRSDSSSSGGTVDTVFSYDSSGNITSAITDSHPSGTVTYHHTGLPETVTDATGVATFNSYDSVGRLTSSTLLGDLSDTSDDLQSHFSYDPRGRLMESTDALGRSTTWTYDRRGNATLQTKADGSQLRNEYDAVGNRIASTDALGRVTRFVYDSRGQLVQTLHPDGATEQARYDGAGRIVASLDALGQETLFDYNAQGALISTTAATGTAEEAITTNRYNQFGEPIETVDALGHVQQWEHDLLGRVTKTQILDQLDSSTPETPVHTPISVSTVDYDANGNVVQNVTYNVAELAGETTTLLSENPRSLLITHPQHVQVTRTEYEVFNRPIEAFHADNTSTRTDYDDAGRIRFQYNELNRVTEQKYDPYGRPIESIAPDPDGPSNSLPSPVTRFEYDAVGNRTASIDARGNRTQYAYDALNRNIISTNAEHDEQRVLYDAVGLVVATVDALGRASYTQYDERGRAKLARTPDPDGDGPQHASETHSQYDSAGNLIEQTDPRGVTTSLEYDAQNRLVRTIEQSYIDNELTEVIDDGDSGFRVVTDTFPIESQSTGYAGDSLFISAPTAQDSPTARWKFENLEPGHYRLLATWEGRVDASDNVTAVISGAIANLVLGGFDQTTTPTEVTRTDNGVTRSWVELLSEVEVTVTGSQTLKIIMSTEQGEHLVADAVRLERIVNNRSSYDANDNLIAEIDTLGRQTDYSYDELNRLITSTLPDPDGATHPLPRPQTTLQYDGYSNVVHTLEDRGGQNREQVSAYDLRNRLVSETRDANASSNEELTTTFGYDSVGNRVRQIEAAGTPEQKVTQYRYDRLDRLISEWYHSEETVLSDWQQAVISSYDSQGNLVSQIDRVRYQDAGQTLYHSATTQFAYDKLNRATSVTTDAGGALAATTVSRYDAVGNLLQTTDPLGRATRHELDRLNRTIKTVAPDPDGSLTTLAGSATTFSFDSAGNLLEETNGEGETKRFVYDHRNRLASSFDALNAETRFVYDTEDNRISHIDPLGNQTASTYDALNRLTSESIDLNGTTATRLNLYDAQGNLAETTDRDGRRTTLEYDRLDRLRFERWLDGSAAVIHTIEWQADHLGRVLLQQDGSTVDTFDYDILDRITAARNYDPAATNSSSPRVEQRWEYDRLDPADNDEFVRIHASQHQIDLGTQIAQSTFSTDRRGRTVQLVDTLGSNAAKTLDFSYDLANQLTGLTRTGDNGNFSFGTDYDYDHAGRIKHFSHFTLPSSPFTSYSYQYDRADRITQQTTDHDVSIAALSPLAASQTENFSFDNAGQLTTDANQTYVYDDNGNRTDNGLVTSTHNRLIEDANNTYTYDLEGNRIRSDSKNDSSYTLYTWDHRNRLTQVTHYDTSNQPVSTVDNRYDAANQLVAQTVAGSTQHYVSNDNPVSNGKQRVLELADNGTVLRRATWGPVVDQLMHEESFNASGQLQQTLWAANDHTGSVRQLLDLNEDVVEHRDFDSFGDLDQAFNETGTLIGAALMQSSVGFTGKHFDSDTKLQYSNARWYDPSVGRFLSEDPVGFSLFASKHHYPAKPQAPRPKAPLKNRRS